MNTEKQHRHLTAKQNGQSRKWDTVRTLGLTRKLSESAIITV